MDRKAQFLTQKNMAAGGSGPTGLITCWLVKPGVEILTSKASQIDGMRNTSNEGPFSPEIKLCTL
jgi:hypothetical protein